MRKQEQVYCTAGNHIIAPADWRSQYNMCAAHLVIARGAAQQVTPAPCIECAVNPREYGIFCRCCFEQLRACDAKWAAAWYGQDWQDAMDAAREVSRG